MCSVVKSVAICLMMILNGISTLMALIFLIVGALFVSFPKFVVRVLFDQLRLELRDLTLRAGVLTQETEDFQLQIFTGFLGNLLVGIGLVLFVVSIIGDVCLTSTCLPQLMYLYAAVLWGVFLVEFFIACYLYGGPSAFGPIVKPYLKETIKSNFVGIGSKDTVSAVWNSVMLYFECCGVDGPGDFDNAVYWNKSFDYKGRNVSLTVPVACCKIPDTVTLKCISSNSYVGCYQKIYEAFLSELERPEFVFSIIAFLGYQLTLAALAVVAVSSHQKIATPEVNVGRV